MTVPWLGPSLDYASHARFAGLLTTSIDITFIRFNVLQSVNISIDFQTVINPRKDCSYNNHINLHWLHQGAAAALRQSKIINLKY